MAIEALESRVQQPAYYHRQYEHDVEDLKPENRRFQKAKRVAVIALPFLSLYQPLGSIISVGMNTIRTMSSLTQLEKAFIAEDSITKDKAIAIFQTAIASAAVAAVIFGNIYGMAITSSHDILIDLYQMSIALQKHQSEKALEKFLQVVSNSLYLIMILHGSLEIIVLSFAAQILLELYKSQGSFRKFINSKKEDRDVLDLLEGFAHLSMAGIRGYQMQSMFEMLLFKWKLEKIIEEHQILHKDNLQNQNSSYNEGIMEATDSCDWGCCIQVKTETGIIEWKASNLELSKWVGHKITLTCADWVSQYGRMYTLKNMTTGQSVTAYIHQILGGTINSNPFISSCEDKIIGLSNGSKWMFEDNAKCSSWTANDRIFITRDFATQKHLLINLSEGRNREFIEVHPII